MSSVFDFIVIGAGASGCVVASRLAQSEARPTVLLLEAGGKNDNPEHLLAKDRFNIAYNTALGLNWNYETEPQLGRHRINYARGKGLGGSTAINFCAWTNGSSGDWDEWVRLTGDEQFSWKHARRHLNKIEQLNPQIPESKMSRYVNAKMGVHSSSGQVHLMYGDAWVSNVETIYRAAEQIGFPMNEDIGSGDPIGFGMAPVSIKDGLRVTSAMSYLSDKPDNFTVITDSLVARIVFDGDVAIGVETQDGRHIRASKEVILSAGALNSPQTLMLSGLGPKDELQKHGVEIVKKLPHVGQNLKDHPFSCAGIVLERTKESPPNMAPQTPTPMAFLKSETSLSSPEFKALPTETKRFLTSPTIPTLELIGLTMAPAKSMKYTPTDDTYFLGASCVLMNEQSSGTVTLRSPDPRDPPVIDPRFLTHPYDRAALIDACRQMMRLLRAPVYAGSTLRILGPQGDSDEELWAHIETQLHSIWHMTGTVRMGKSAADGCVDTQFRVFGVERLRVVDVSVCMFAPNAHTQSTAYIIGEMAAEKIIAAHGLDT